MTDYFELTKTKMDKALGALIDQFDGVRTGRATPALLNDVNIVYYGVDTPLNQLAQISVVEGSQLVIKPFDPQILKDIEKSIFAANLGLTPQNDGTLIRVNVPRLTEETRKEIAKDIGKMGEDAKIAIRNIRRESNDSIKKDDSLSEDEEKKHLERIQKITDEFVKKIDTSVSEKTVEIMTV